MSEKFKFVIWDTKRKKLFIGHCVKFNADGTLRRVECFSREDAKYQVAIRDEV